MFRNAKILPALVLAAALPLLGTPAGAADLDAPVQLNDHIVVSENVIRVGDLFTNAGENAEVAVAYAPEPGKRAVLDARWLYRVAKAYKVQWRPLGATVHSVVERDSVVVSKDEIKMQLMMALADQGVDPDMDVDFATRFQQIHLPAGSAGGIEVRNLEFHPRTGRFTAIVGDPGGGIDGQARITGRVFRTVEVPVLAERVLRGDVIRENDIEWVRLKADRVQRDAIVDVEDLVGMTPKRGIRAGAPVRVSDVRRPRLIKKNSLVTIVHQVPHMTLTAQGKALEHGADGDLVRIMNQRSGHVIEAEVIGDGRVAVRTLTQELSMNVN